MSDGGFLYDLGLAFAAGVTAAQSNAQAVLDGLPNTVKGTALSGQGPTDFNAGVQALIDSLRQAGDGTAQTGAKAVDAQATLAGVRQNVVALQQGLQSVQDSLKPPSGGKSYDGSLGADTTSGWGASWNLYGATGAVYLTQKQYAWADSGGASRQTVGVYNGGQTATDNMISSIILSTLMESPPGGSSADACSNWALGRCSADGQNFVYARLRYNRVTLGFCKAGVYTDWTTVAVSPAAGARLELQCGNSANARQFSVRLNSATVIDSYTESGANSLYGAGYRYGGQAMTSDARYGSESTPGIVYAWKLQDLNPPGIIGSGLYVCRFNTAAVVVNSGVQSTLGGFFDNVVYCSSDLTWNPSTGAVTITNPGFYQFDLNVQFNTLQTSSQQWFVSLGQNSAVAVSGPIITGTNTEDAFYGQFNLYCNAGDVMTPLVAPATRNQSIIGGSTGTFSRFQVAKLNP